MPATKRNPREDKPAVGLSGYLVVLRHTMDDLPIGLYATLQDAERVAEKVKPMPSEYIRAVYNTDCSTPCSVIIVKFACGVPIKCECTKVFSR